MAHPNEIRLLSVSFESLIDLRIAERKPADDSFNECAFGREFQQPIGFLEGLTRLYGDAAVDACILEQGF